MRKKVWVYGCLLMTAINLAGCGETNVSESASSTEATVSFEISESPLSDDLPVVEELPEETGSVITYEIKTETRNDNDGKEIIKYECPFFSCSDRAYEDVVGAINKTFLDYMTADLEENSEMSQEVFDVSINSEDGLIFISVGRTQEVGGPHPNNYHDDFVINTETKDFAAITDVFSFGDDRIDEIVDQIHEAHSDKDKEVLKADVKKAIDADKAGWRVEENNLVLWFDYDDITGAYHGDGEYAAIVPLK